MAREGASSRAASVLTFDLRDDPISLTQAADLAGVSRAVVDNWLSRGYRALDGSRARLPVIERDERGRPRVRGIDVLRAEAATRRRARRLVDLPV